MSEVAETGIWEKTLSAGGLRSAIKKEVDSEKERERERERGGIKANGDRAKETVRNTETP